MRAALAWIVISLPSALACGDGNGDGQFHLPDASAGDLPGGDLPGGDMWPSRDDPHEMCRVMIECVKAIGRDEWGEASFDFTLEQYGEAAECFTRLSPEECGDDCYVGLANGNSVHPELAVCAVCRSDADCRPEYGAVCDTSTHGCFDCRSDADCATNEGGHKCDVERKTCVLCLTDADCAEYGGAVCDTAERIGGAPSIPACYLCLVSDDCPTEHPTCNTDLFRCE